MSTSWRALCLDLQLWTHVDFAPIASFLPVETFKPLFRAMAPYVRHLSLRGMDNLPSQFFSELCDFSCLEVLDVRGCKSLSEGDIAQILRHSPKLRHINAKGVQNFTSRSVRMLASTGIMLEFLDVTRCMEVTFNDLAEYIRQMSAAQATTLKTLKIASLRAYGRTTTDLFRLIASRLTSLKVLDLNDSFTRDEDIQDWSNTHRKLATTSSLIHLVLSYCAPLNRDNIDDLTDLIPQMEILEMAGIPTMFREGDSYATLPRMLSGMPRLKRIDLDMTGKRGGIGDEVLEVLGGFEMEEVRMGDAKKVTKGAWERFALRCKTLRVLEVNVSGLSDSLDIYQSVRLGGGWNGILKCEIGSSCQGKR